MDFNIIKISSMYKILSWIIRYYGLQDYKRIKKKI